MTARKLPRKKKEVKYPPAEVLWKVLLDYNRYVQTLVDHIKRLQRELDGR